MKPFEPVRLGRLHAHAPFWRTLSYVQHTGGVHHGFHRCDESARPALLQFLEAHAAPYRSIRVTGHSLGGALALLTAMDLATAGLPFRCLEVYSFAAPS